MHALTSCILSECWARKLRLEREEQTSILEGKEVVHLFSNISRPKQRDQIPY